MYVEAEEVREIATQMTENAIADSVLESLIVRASRMFDLCVGCVPGYFEAREEGDATELTFYGDGTNFLRLPPYVPGSLESAGFPDGYTAQTYTERDGYLVRTDSSGLFFSSFVAGWYAGVPITLTAQWGYETTPDDVKAAIIELVINLFRETDPAHIKLVGIEGQPLRETMPPRVKETAKRYRVKQAVFV